MAQEATTNWISLAIKSIQYSNLSEAFTIELPTSLQVPICDTLVVLSEAQYPFDEHDNFNWRTLILGSLHLISVDNKSSTQMKTVAATVTKNFIHQMRSRFKDLIFIGEYFNYIDMVTCDQHMTEATKKQLSIVLQRFDECLQKCFTIDEFIEESATKQVARQIKKFVTQFDDKKVPVLHYPCAPIHSLHTQTHCKQF